MPKTKVISASLRNRRQSAQAASSQPKPNDAFVELHDFVFGNGETWASLKLHYLTLGTPRRDANGAIDNGILLLHGTAGSAADLVQAAFFDALYGAGKPLDLNRHFLVIPDAIGAGGSSKPSESSRASSEAFSDVGMASGATGPTTVYRSPASVSAPLSTTALVSSSMNSGTPSVRSMIWSATSLGSALPPVMLVII